MSSVPTPSNEKKSTKPTTVEDVLKFKAPTKTFMCPFDPNVGITFLQFKIRDTATQKALFDTADYQPAPEDMPKTEDDLRTIKYSFPKEVLKNKEIGTTLTFSVGPKPIHNFRMIERHYYKSQLIQSFDFTFPFCIPNSTNTWECIYKVPKIDEKTLKEIVAHPFETTSDTFYFMNEKELVMHNKAYYNYFE